MSGEWQLISSEVLDIEIENTQDRQLDNGYGDYTKERHEWLNDIDIETIVKQAKAKRN